MVGVFPEGVGGSLLAGSSMLPLGQPHQDRPPASSDALGDILGGRRGDRYPWYPPSPLVSEYADLVLFLTVRIEAVGMVPFVPTFKGAQSRSDGRQNPMLRTGSLVTQSQRVLQTRQSAEHGRPADPDGTGEEHNPSSRTSSLRCGCLRSSQCT